MRQRIALVVGIVAVFAGGLYAQEYIYAFRTGYVEIPVGQPCGLNGLKGSVSTMVYDTNAWMLFTCNDDRVVLRRYINPNDKVHAPQQVIVMNPEAFAQAPQPIAPPPPPAPAAVPLTKAEMQQWGIWGIDFNKIGSPTPVPGLPGKQFAHNGTAWVIMDAR